MKQIKDTCSKRGLQTRYHGTCLQTVRSALLRWHILVSLDELEHMWCAGRTAVASRWCGGT